MAPALIALVDAGEHDPGVVHAAVGTWAWHWTVSAHLLTLPDRPIGTRLGVRAELAAPVELAGPGRTLTALAGTDLLRAAAVTDQSHS